MIEKRGTGNWQPGTGQWRSRAAALRSRFPVFHFPVPGSRFLLLLLLVSCAKPRAATLHERSATNVLVGSCADPDRDGIASASGKRVRADRDLNGDGIAEPVTADRAACTSDGNCYWNVFSSAVDGSCSRYLGTLAGAALEPGTAAGDQGFVDVRALWQLGPGRVLVQEYRFVRGGYQVTSALLCRAGNDDQLRCAEENR